MLANCSPFHWWNEDDGALPTIAVIDAEWQRAKAERELLAKIRVEQAIDAGIDLQTAGEPDEWAGGGRVVASEVTSEELDMSMKEMSLSELAAEYLKTGDKFIFAYAKYKYGVEHWKDALDNAKEASNAR